MKIRKSNILTILTLIFSIIMMTLLPLPTVEAANLTVSKSNVTMENGKSSSITINASTHTGRLDIISSNTSVATVSDSNLWVENNSKTITISAKGAGTAKITIKGELYDAEVEEEKEFTQTINVTVTKAASSDSNNAGETTNGTTGGTQNSGSSGSSSNSDQTSKPGGSNSGSQTSNKPSFGGTSNSSSANSSSSGSSTSKPSNSSSTTSNKPTQNDTTVTEQPVTIEENNTEAIEAENLISEENKVEEIVEVQQEIVDTENKQEEINNLEENKLNGKTMLIAIIGLIALMMIFIGIGVSKNILKK